VRHPQDTFPATAGGLVVEERIEHGDDHFRPFDGKAFLTRIPGVQELLEERCLIEFLEDTALRRRIRRGPIAGGFHPFLQPQPLPRILQVQVLDPDRPAVGLAQRLEQLVQPHGSGAERARHKEKEVPIVLGQLERGGFQQWMVHRAGGKGIQA